MRGEAVGKVRCVQHSAALILFFFFFFFLPSGRATLPKPKLPADPSKTDFSQFANTSLLTAA